MKNADMPAMPFTTWDNDLNQVIEQGNGLTKREAFAVAAMRGLLSSGDYNAYTVHKDSVFHADALLSELVKVPRGCGIRSLTGRCHEPQGRIRH